METCVRVTHELQHCIGLHVAAAGRRVESLRLACAHCWCCCMLFRLNVRGKNANYLEIETFLINSARGGGLRGRAEDNKQYMRGAVQTTL